jgi:hypothetical protein
MCAPDAQLRRDRTGTDDRGTNGTGIDYRGAMSGNRGGRGGGPVRAWLRNAFRRERRWISDPIERNAHDTTVRSRLFGDGAPAASADDQERRDVREESE